MNISHRNELLFSLTHPRNASDTRDFPFPFSLSCSSLSCSFLFHTKYFPGFCIFYVTCIVTYHQERISKTQHCVSKSKKSREAESSVEKKIPVDFKKCRMLSMLEQKKIKKSRSFNTTESSFHPFSRQSKIHPSILPSSQAATMLMMMLGNGEVESPATPVR